MKKIYETYCKLEEIIVGDGVRQYRCTDFLSRLLPAVQQAHRLG